MTIKKMSVDVVAGQVRWTDEQGEHMGGLDTPEAFDAISDVWLRSGWGTKHVYSFTWFGRPIIQLPEDLIRVQEIVYRVRPTVLVETGVAHGGSLVFYASLFQACGAGRVIGVDLEIRPHNRAAIESHPLAHRIALIEGNSVDPRVVSHVRSRIRDDDIVMVMLDSNHSKAHVLAELEAYGPLVSPGSYIVAADGIMEKLAGAPRTEADWSWNNPAAAADEFVRLHPEFEQVKPDFLFNEGQVKNMVTYWPRAWLRRRAG